jgi:hypothetical protein
MGRLIDADAFIKDVCNNCDGWCDCVKCDCLNCKSEHRCDFIQQVHEQPTVDAVPVVRCWKCKYFVKNTWECVRLADRFGDEYSDARVYPEYYCADGERRTE